MGKDAFRKKRKGRRTYVLDALRPNTRGKGALKVSGNLYEKE